MILAFRSWSIKLKKGKKLKGIKEVNIGQSFKELKMNEYIDKYLQLILYYFI